MNQILTIPEAIKASSELQKQHKTVVVVGGCFDVLHAGHKLFLEEAKKQGDVLLVLLESDASVRKRKGSSRPSNSLETRATNLLNLPTVDSVITLPFPFTDTDYDQLVTSLKPAIIATTKGDPLKFHKQRQANLIHAKVVEVVERLEEHSTTNLLKI